MFDDKKREADVRIRAVIEPFVQPGEALVGCLMATAKSSFSAKMYAIGVTDQRLIMVQVDRKFEPKGEPVSVRPDDIVKSSVDGFGGGPRHFLTEDLGDIRVDTTDEKYKLLMMGGGLDQMFVGDGQMAGKQAFLEFLHAARGLTK
jgi:hypothetical protein